MVAPSDHRSDSGPPCEDGHHIRAIQPRRGTCLAQGPLAQDFALARGHLRWRRDLLHRYLPVKEVVVSQPDRSHPASAEHLHQPITPSENTVTIAAAHGLTGQVRPRPAGRLSRSQCPGRHSPHRADRADPPDRPLARISLVSGPSTTALMLHGDLERLHVGRAASLCPAPRTTAQPHCRPPPSPAPWPGKSEAITALTPCRSALAAGRRSWPPRGTLSSGSSNWPAAATSPLPAVATPKTPPVCAGHTRTQLALT
jgi:hypothetical protein